jgi:hypothetical protein
VHIPQILCMMSPSKPKLALTMVMVRLAVAAGNGQGFYWTTALFLLDVGVQSVATLQYTSSPSSLSSPSRRPVSPGTVLALSALVAIEVRDALVHPSALALADFSTAVWAQACSGCVWSRAD